MTVAMHFNIADLFEAVADAVPERSAIVCGEDRVQYQELEQRANQMAHYLVAIGIGSGDHVGLYLYNCIEYLEAMLACFKIRAVPININYRYVDDELAYIFDNADLKACIHHREFIPAIDAVRARAPMVRHYICVDDGSDKPLQWISASNYHVVRNSKPTVRDFGERADDDLFILYTGGTTGMPKGVMWPHKAVFFAAMGGGGYFHPDGAISEPQQITSRITEHPMTNMALAPLMHGACWWSACIQLLAGNRVVLNPNTSLKGEQVWDIVEREAVNMLTIVGDAIAIPLLDALAAHPGRWNLSSVYGISSGGAVFSAAKQQAFREYFPNVVIANAFGSSEAGAMGADSGGRRGEDDGLGKISRSDFMSVIITDSNQPPRHAQPGESGIFARTGYIPTGYYKDPLKTAETFIPVDGATWLLTGDRARLESDNTITVFGRGSNCINSGGEKIFPEEVEEALKSHRGIFDALVVAVPDERWGSRVAAVIQLRRGVELSLADIQTHCRQSIASYKLPREWHCIAEIPRAPSGKPNYTRARELALSGAFAGR